jgi:hypothetical protein
MFQALVGMMMGLGAMAAGLNAGVWNYSPAFASFLVNAVILLFCLNMVSFCLYLGLLQALWFDVWMDPLRSRVQRIVQQIRLTSGHTRHGH